MNDRPPEGTQFCLYVDETMLTVNGYIPAAVFENTSGYWPMIGSGEQSQPWYFGDDLARARELVVQANAERGIDEVEATRIVASSIRTAIREDAARQEADERMERIKKGQPAWPSSRS